MKFLLPKGKPAQGKVTFVPYNDFSGPLPLLIFLHGAGEVGTDPNTLRKKDPTFFARETFKDQESTLFPFIVVTPICPENRWEPQRVIALLDQVLSENKFRFQIDPDRVHLTGYSMGGFGTFEAAVLLEAELEVQMMVLAATALVALTMMVTTRIVVQAGMKMEIQIVSLADDINC